MNPYLIAGLSVLVTAIILLTLYFTVAKRSFRKNLEKRIGAMRNGILVNNVKLNFNQDIEYLMFMIEFKVGNAKKMILEPLQVTHERAMINEKMLNQHTEDITLAVIECLSPDYRQVLYKYFTPQSLNEFVTEAVFASVSGTIITMNGKRIQNFYSRGPREAK